jgi:hypothetical protein
MLILRERDHAVADIAGREHVEIFTKAAGGPAIVRDGDNRRETADEAWEFRLGEGRLRVKLDVRGARRWNVTLETAEESGKAGASTDRYDSELPGSGKGRHCAVTVYREAGVQGPEGGYRLYQASG